MTVLIDLSFVEATRYLKLRMTLPDDCVANNCAALSNESTPVEAVEAGRCPICLLTYEEAIETGWRSTVEAENERM